MYGVLVTVWGILPRRSSRVPGVAAVATEGFVRGFERAR